MNALTEEIGPRLAERGWIEDAPSLAVMAALDRAEIDFRFVGGVVRDSLLGRPVADIDIATPSSPDAVMRAAAAAGLAAIPTGIAHGTITVVALKTRFEITTLRRDVATDGRHAVVAFTDDWREDAARRDFTMNALYADRDGAITDFFGGVGDARGGRVRFIGGPADRIAEDGLRILRFFRFHAWYGRGELDPEGFAAAAAAAGAIDRLSGERVRDEVLKLLRAPDPVPVWRAMIDAGIMAHLIPDAIRTDDASQLIAAEAVLGLPADALRRLAALIGPLDAPAVAALADRLRLSTRDAAGLGAMAAPGVTIEAIAADGFARMLYQFDASALRDAALVSYARSGRPDLSAIADLLQFAARWTRPRFPVSGSDVVASGIAPGPAVGALLAALEAWWTAQGFRPDRDRCLRELARLAGRG